MEQNNQSMQLKCEWVETTAYTTEMRNATNGRLYFYVNGKNILAGSYGGAGQTYEYPLIL